MIPYIDLPGVQLRSILRPSYFNDVEGLTPGFTAQSIAMNSSVLNSQMRKRYGGILPWGQSPPIFVATGPTPPFVALQGQPTLGSMVLQIQITTAGLTGTAAFKWSGNGGLTFTGPITTAPTVVLGTTGLTAVFLPTSTFSTSDAYAAAPPVPETLLRWLTDLVTSDVATRHGVNTNDPLWDKIEKRADLARTQVQEAANSKDGLWDLPLSEDLGSAVDTGGPTAYSEQSPYAWTYAQERAALQGPGRGYCAACGGSPCICRNGLVGG